jgi:Pycsar effector protein
MAPSVLEGELAAVRGELARVDAKCATLAALAGAALAFLVTQTAAPHHPVVVRVMLGAAGLLLAAAVVVLLAGVLRPRLGATGFCRWARLSAAAVVAELGEVDQAHHAANELVVLSRITVVRQRTLRRAVDLLTGGVTLIGCATVAGVIA